MAVEAAEAEVRSDEDSPRYHGSVIIEWPARMGDGSRPLCGWGCSIFDAATGRQIYTAEKISIPAVTAEAQDVILCWLTMFADGNGNPVMELERHPDPEGRPGHIGSYVIPAVDESGKPRTGVFPFQVAEMRVRQA